MKKAIVQISLFTAVLLSSCTKELVYEPSGGRVAFADGKATITLGEAGTLEERLSAATDLMELTSLCISGPVNGSDLKLIREMAGADSVGNETHGKLESLDLSKAQIVKGGDVHFVYEDEKCYIDEDNTLPRYAFGYCKLKEIVLPEEITALGSQAFYHCDSLVSVNIPSSLQQIGRSAFCYCSKLTSPITIPSAVSIIPSYTFYECNALPQITLSDNVTTIGSYAFYRCQKITDVGSSLPSLDSIAAHVFQGCYRLQQAYLPRRMTIVPEYAFASCNAIQNVDLTGKTIIGKYAFNGCNKLTTAVLPNELKVIGAYAFANTKLTGTLSLPCSVREVGYASFYSTDISAVEINSDIALGERPDVNVVYDTFAYCNSLKSVKIAEGCTVINLPFNNCKALSSIQLPSTLKSIGEEHDFLDFLSPSGIFSYCTALKSITLPDGLELIGYRTFRGCTALTDVSIPIGVRKIDAQAFYNCSSLTKIVIPKQVSEIESYVLAGCSSLTDVQILSPIEEIPQGMFENCTNLTSFTIPTAVKTIGYESFKGSGLITMTLPEGITSIGDMAFMNCELLKDVHLSTTIEMIEPSAFSGCTSLVSVNFADDCKLTTIGNSCFYQCTSLNTIELPAAIRVIEANVFDTSGLTSIKIPALVSTIGDGCFANCRRLLSFTNLAMTPQAVSSTVFSGVPLQQATLRVPADAESVYRSTPVWNTFGRIEALTDN